MGEVEAERARWWCPALQVAVMVRWLRPGADRRVATLRVKGLFVHMWWASGGGRSGCRRVRTLPNHFGVLPPGNPGDG